MSNEEHKMARQTLRILLGLIGVVVIWLGLNVSLGGIITLGWQGPTDFLTVENHSAFSVQDNHVRFIAGVWTGVGLFMIIGAIFLEKFKSILLALMVMVFLGGLARLTAGDPALLMSSKIAPSLLMELIVFPLLGLWVYRTTREETIK
jgi:hypothetical protein